jgi:alanine-synthesizing transaminase
MFSSRIPSDRCPNRLARTLAELRAAGTPCLDLTESNPTRAGIEYPQALLSGLADPRGLAYMPEPFGLLDARRAVSSEIARRGVAVSAERIVLTASTSEAYALLFELLCDPGDDVLVPRPGYPLFAHLARLEGIAVTPYDLVYEGRWRVDFPSIARALGPRSRAIVAINPNNPTGSCLSPDEVERLADLARARGLALIGDEVFADYVWNGATPRSVLSQDRALAFSLGGLSKSVGLPQLKLAWVAAAGPDDLVGEALGRLEIATDAFLSVATPVQLALREILSGGAAVRERIRARIATNLGILDRLLAEHRSCRRLAADGGWYAVIQVPAPSSEEDLVVELLARDHVLVHPGYFFDFAREAFLILSLLTPEEAFRRGASLLVRRACG